MKNLECSNSDDRRSDKRRVFFLKLFLLVLFFLFVLASKVFSQSLGSQLKIIFGDALTTYGKNDFSRFVGKSLSTSGNMQHNMELIQAQNNQTLNINLPPNTYIGQNNQVLPNQGYQWANPNNASDLGVVPINNLSTLQPYDLSILGEKYAYPFGRLRSALTKRAINSPVPLTGLALNLLFTYNWYSDLNGDKIIGLDEFNNIKRTFKFGEPIGFAFTFVAKNGSKKSGKDIENVLSFQIKIFNQLNGEVIAEEKRLFHNPEGNVRFEQMVMYESLGNSFPIGIYLISVSMTPSDKSVPIYVATFLKEYFEVIE